MIRLLFSLWASLPWGSVYEEYLSPVPFFSWFDVSGFTKRLGWLEQEGDDKCECTATSAGTSCSTLCELVQFISVHIFTISNRMIRRQR